MGSPPSKRPSPVLNSPRRLKPFSINYHAYAGEHAGVLQSVKEQLLKARTAALVPISANRYGAIVDGFFAAQIDQIGQATWRIRERGFLQTIRFDAAEGRAVDIQSSVGVIGQSRKGAALYVALDETIEPAVIVLSSDLRSELRRNRLTLVESRWLVRNVAYDDCALSFEAQGYGEGVFTWLGAPLKRHTIIVARAGEEIWRQTAQADDMGQLMFVLPVRATEMVTVRISCGEGGAS